MLTTTTNLTAEEAVVAGGLIGGMFATIGIAALIFYIFTVIASWKIFEKAGEKGWKSLIPIYNFYILYKIVGMKNWFWGLLIFGVIVSVVYSLGGISSTMTAAEVEAYDWGKHWYVIVAIVADIIVTLVAQILYVRNTAKAFGKGTGFAVALFFFPNICWLILGFGSAKYSKKALKD